MKTVKRNAFLSVLTFIAITCFAMALIFATNTSKTVNAAMSPALTRTYYSTSTDGEHVLLATPILGDVSDIYEVGYTFTGFEPTPVQADSLHYYTTINGAGARTLFGVDAYTDTTPMVVWEVKNDIRTENVQAYFKKGERINGVLYPTEPETVLTAPVRVIDTFAALKYGGVNKTNSNKHQSATGLSTDLPVGTAVTVEMDVLVTGTFDASSYIYVVDSVWSTDGGERNAVTDIKSTIVTGDSGWHHVTFTATVRNFPKLRHNSNYETKIDTSSFGNAVYLLTDNTSADAFRYKNVEITTPMIYGGVNKTDSNKHQSATGLSTDLDVGTAVSVTMDVLVTGTFDSSSKIYAVDSVWSVNGGERRDVTDITSTIVTGESGWHTVTFTATVRNFPKLRHNSNYETIIDTSSFGNAVYLLTDNKSADAFRYKNVEIQIFESMTNGVQKTVSPNGFYSAIKGIPTEFELDTAVTVEMDINITGTTADAYVNSSIYWIDSVDSSSNLIKSKTLIYAAPQSDVPTGWIHVSFDAAVRNFSSVTNSSEYAAFDTSACGNGIYLCAHNFKSTASFIYKNIQITNKGYKAPIQGGNNGASDIYYQSITGLSTDLPVGTAVSVTMDVLVTGTFNDYSHIYCADTVYSVSGGELNGNTDIKSTIVTGESGWHTVTFTATVRNFPYLRRNSAYSVIDTSAYGNAVYLISMNKSADSFNYKNVEIIVEGMTSGVKVMTNGGKNSANNYYQTMTGLKTDLEVGTSVTVTMDVKLTSASAFDQWSSLNWIDSVGNNNVPTSTTSIKTAFTSLTDTTTWQTITFTATVRNFEHLQANATQYSSIDTSGFGNAVYILGQANGTGNPLYYKNVEINASMTPGGNNGASNIYYQSITGLSTDFAVGTTVIVDMDVLVTGTFDTYSSIYIVNDVWTVAGGENKNGTNIKTTIVTGDSGWHHVTFTATVKQFDVLRLGTSYPTIDTSAYGNAVYLLSQNKSADSFCYKNVEITEPQTLTPSGNNGGGYYQSITGFATDLAFGTAVTVEMDVYVTGTFDGDCFVYVVDGVDADNAKYAGTNITSTIVTGDSGWHHVTFTATVRNFSALRYNSDYSTVDTSGFGNAVYLITHNKSSDSFNYKNVTITETRNVGISNYKIVVADSKYGASSSPIQNAAEILRDNITAAGGSIDIVSDNTPKSSYEIVLGDTRRNDSAEYDEESYTIKNDGNILYIDAADSRGIIYGAYAWLESVGFRFNNEAATTVPSLADIKVSDIDISYSPAFEYREVVDKSAWDVDWAVSVGINGDIGRTDEENSIRNDEYGGYVWYINNAGRTHTSIGGHPQVGDYHGLVDPYYIPAGRHPEYFAVDANGDPYVTSSDDYTDTQVCLSNEDALSLAKTYLIYWIPRHYNAQTTCRIMVSIMDNDNYCHCDNCEALYATYGTTGAWLMWVNELANHVKNYNNGIYSNVYIETLAYGWTKGLPIGGVVPADNVIVRFCSDFGGCINDRETSTALANEKALLEGWRDICDNVYVWYYSIDYGNYMEIYPNFDDIYYNVNYLYTAGVKGVYSEQFLKNNGEFGELRSYLVAKMLQKPWMTKAEFDALKEDFCNSYYGAAGTYVLSYIDAVKAAMTGDIGKTAEATANNIDFTSDLKTECEGYWDAAESAVSENATLLTRVKKSRLHWTYAMLVNCESSFTTSDYETATYDLANAMYDMNVRRINAVAAIGKGSLTGLSGYRGKNPTKWTYQTDWEGDEAD